VEGALAFPDGNVELLAKDVDVAVIWHLEVVDASHDRWEVIVRGIRRLTRLADNGEHRGESLETWVVVSTARLDKMIGKVHVILPPIGSLGLPVMNCRKSLRCWASYSLMVWSRLRTLLLSRL
jgi:hypothetical protein